MDRSAHRRKTKQPNSLINYAAIGIIHCVKFHGGINEKTFEKTNLTHLYFNIGKKYPLNINSILSSSLGYFGQNLKLSVTILNILDHHKTICSVHFPLGFLFNLLLSNPSKRMLALF